MQYSVQADKYDKVVEHVSKIVGKMETKTPKAIQKVKDMAQNVMKSNIIKQKKRIPTPEEIEKIKERKRRERAENIKKQREAAKLRKA